MLINIEAIYLSYILRKSDFATKVNKLCKKHSQKGLTSHPFSKVSLFTKFPIYFFFIFHVMIDSFINTLTILE